MFRFVKREIYQIFDEMKWKFTFEIKSQEMYNIRGCIHRLVDKYVYNSAYMLALILKEGYKECIRHFLLFFLHAQTQEPDQLLED